MSGVSNTTCDMNIFDTNGIHYAFFTGWCQLNSWAGFEHPWWAGEKHCNLFKFYDTMRYALMPYIYSHSIEANMTGTPICRALPLMFDDVFANNIVSEYMFGDNILVGAFSDKVYLPEGSVWYDAWTGKYYEGGEDVAVEIPVGDDGTFAADVHIPHSLDFYVRTGDYVDGLYFFVGDPVNVTMDLASEKTIV
jgi:alpha-glucosidase (family GH31 glycosyl hydrolase)